jgi:hypothetical protein
MTFTTKATLGLTLAAIVFGEGVLGSKSVAGPPVSGAYGYHGAIWHQPSIRYQSTYHHDYWDWNPLQGWNSRGHYHSQPVFVPGHWDHYHYNQVQPNPWFHP